MITGTGKTALQTGGETRFVVACNAKPATLVGHVKITFHPEGVIVNCGGGCGNARLKIVPQPRLPPAEDVPYTVVPDKINPPIGKAPSLLVRWDHELIYHDVYFLIDA